MAFDFNPTTGKLDLTGQPAGGTRVNPFPATGFYQYNASGVLQLITIDASGHFVVTPVQMTTGTPYGLLLALTQP